ncbi:site-specific integrase [Clostridium botulinum]|nr:hypothetical protein KU41_01130 [Clostridium botulinum]MBY6803376.1 tyrosine-type recombinase/integrase [Clostridium botulinum]MBY6813921.1 tyrosine-type recombinase/integrase [Clostridium botulinum]MBY6820138.1 tyrosine-type recombinase/integrase [Clostridium botulinum]NFJ52551.1 site-specific integrase [Clostridium botulinum]
MSYIYIRDLENLDIEIEERIEFNVSDKERYLKLFEEKVLKGVIKSGVKFEDSKWCIRIGGVEKNFIFPNDIEFKKMSRIFDRECKEFQLAYKAFILFNIHQYSALKGFNYKMRKIFDENNCPKFDNRISGLLKRFIEYVKVPYEHTVYFDKFMDEHDKENEERILPEFIDIFKMSDIINDIIEYKNIIDYKDYLLTIMWWKICSIVPLRPSEFIRMKFGCNLEENNSFYLKVLRSKAKSKEKIKNVSEIDDYYYEDKLKIDKSLYLLIEEYKEILKNTFSCTKMSELFPFILIEKSKYYRKNSKTNRKANLDIVTYKDLFINIQRFYIDVVNKEYGFKPISKYIKKDKNETFIEKLTPNDLRHIAIINLVLLGVDVLEIMYIAGHKDINTTFNYYNHVKTFSKGYAIGYATATKKKNINKTPGEYENSRIGEFSRIMNQINNVKIKPKRVEGGYCYYHDIEKDMTLCIQNEGNHGICKYFVVDNIKYYQDQINNVENSLDTDIKMLIELIKDMNGVCKFNELYQTTSASVSRNISKLAVLNSRLIEFKK